MQQDKDIQNKLQQLENQQEPDTEHMDAHWQNMQSILKTGATGKAMLKKPWLWVATITILITLLLWYHVGYNKGNGANTIATANNNSNSSMTNTVTIDTSKKGKRIISIRTKRYTSKWGIEQTVATGTSDSTQTGTVDRRSLLNALLNELAKSPGEFIIDNGRDTLLLGSDSSILFIPSNSLGGSDNIKISLTEFYKLSDIILNQLSTTSDTDLLETGGMINVTATVNGKPVELQKGQHITWYMSDTSKQVQQMQLFNGVKINKSINWLPQARYFNTTYTVTEARVLNIHDEPYEWDDPDGSSVAFFLMSDNCKMSKDSLKKLLTNQFPKYNKIHVRSKLKNNFFNRIFNLKSFRLTDSDAGTDDFFSIGDSTWMEKTDADKYHLKPTAIRVTQHQSISISGEEEDLLFKDSLAEQLNNRYRINITQLGWINCDHFWNDKREKVLYTADLGDSAINYYTVLVFKNERSIMLGRPDGNKVVFPNLPIGEPVKIISIGIAKNGERIFAMKDTVVSKEIFNGLTFESSSAPAIKTALVKLDK